MFERILKDPNALVRHQHGPLAEERRRYLAHCAEERMSYETLRGTANYLLIVSNVLNLAERPGKLITQREIDAAAVRWVNRPRKHTKGIDTFTGHAVRWLSFLRRLQLPPVVQSPYADHLDQWAHYRLRERGLSPRTVKLDLRTLHRFLAQLKKAGLQLKKVTVAQVDKLLASDVRNGRYARTTISRFASTLRMFFEFGEKRGWCRRGLGTAIMAPRVYSHESLPIGPSWDDVKRVLAAEEGDRPTAIRNRAILMLLVIYGLRAGEVAKLRLEDFDWKQERFTVVRGKGRKPRTYPLCREVGDAILRYLCEVRPRSTHREVFLTRIAPIKPLEPCAVGEMVQKRLHAIGLKLPHYGSHVLRHACASHLLAQGLSLKEIGDHLGHTSPQTTRIYAKVDLAALRTVGDFNLEGLL